MGDYRHQTWQILEQLISAPEDALASLLREHLSPDSVWDVAAPVHRLEGPEAVAEGLILPLRRALSHARRRDEVFIGGQNRRTQGGQWVASVTHYLGNFREPLFGIAPCDRLVWLRSGEFYRLEAGKIAEAKLIIDGVDLMRQAGHFPLPWMLGTEMLYPAHATQDGLMPEATPEQSQASMDLVDRMLENLMVFDPDTYVSQAQTGPDGCWHDDMLWYGPGGIGSNYRWEGFQKDHRVPFLTAFPDRMGGMHFCRFGDGNYAAVGGWPSMTMTHKGEYLGVPATGKSLTLRIMDFYRCADGRLKENWVFLDYLDLFEQMGVDLLAKSRALEAQAT